MAHGSRLRMFNSQPFLSLGWCALPSLLSGRQCLPLAAPLWPAGPYLSAGLREISSPACRNSGKYMFSFETWHERLLPEAWEHYNRQGDGTIVMDQQDELVTS